MRKIILEQQKKVFFTFFSVALFVLFSSIALAAGNIPTMGYDITLNNGDSVVFTMRDYASMQVAVKPTIWGQAGKIELYGTTAQSNKDLQKVYSVLLYANASIDSSGYWKREKECGRGGCPAIKWVCIGGPLRLVIIKLVPK